MKLNYRPAALMLSLLAGATFAGAHQATQAPRPMPVPRMPIPVSALLPDTQRLFDREVADGRVPGIVGAIGRGDGPTLFVDAGRIATDPGAPAADPDTLWRVYSMTKPVTAMAAMILIQEGKLGLDTPLSTYLPAFAHMKVLTDPDHSLASRPATRPITIRELLTHTAGLGYSIVQKGPIAQAYEHAGILPFATDARTEAAMRRARPATLAALADRVATLPLVYEPGTRWSYSIGLDVMGAVIERVSGMPFDRFVATRIFAPLEMRSSFWTVPASDARRLATDYAMVAGALTPVDPGATSLWLRPPSFPYGGAGLVMSARDYDRFLHCLQDGGSLDGVLVLTPETTALMLSNLLPVGIAFTGMPGSDRPAGAQPAGFGAGGAVYTAAGPGGYPGKGSYGWEGAAGSFAYVDPTNRTRVTVMLNVLGGVPGLRARMAAALAADARRVAR